MSQRVFIDCLNKQRKAYNCNFGSIMGSITLTALFGIGKGLIWGLAAGAIGYAVGGWISNKLYTGELQTKIYINMPYADIWLGEHVPASSNKYEL